MGRLTRGGIVGVFFGLILVLSALIIPAVPVSAIHWCQPLGIGLSPTSGYVGDRTSVSITLTNNIGDALNVNSIGVKFAWDPTTWDWGKMSLAGHASGTNTFGETMASVPGDYTVDLTINGQAVGDLFAQNCYASRTITVYAVPPPPTVIVTANPTTGTAPLTVSFSATVSNGLGPFGYYWTLGDGAGTVCSGCGGPPDIIPVCTQYCGPSVSHAYASAGTYTAKVIVTDSRSRSGSDSVSVTVAQAPPSGGGGGSGSGGGGSNSPGGGGGGIDLSSLGPLLAIVLVVVVAIAGVAVAVGRRKKGSPPTQPPSGPQ